MREDIIVGEYYSINNQLLRCADIHHKFNNSKYRLYEVLRTKNGKLIFGDDHIARMKVGFDKLGIGKLFNPMRAREILSTVVEANNHITGNVKLYGAAGDKKIEMAAAYIPHKYPPAELYAQGIEMNLLFAERVQPGIKQLEVSNDIQAKVKPEEKLRYYESLLVDNDGYISEGSKSNFFLIQGKALYSAPEENILPGITRKYVMQIASQEGIEIIQKNISFNDLDSFEAAFICGTSPGVLPVRQLQEIKYNVNNELLRKVMNLFSSLLESQSRL